MVIDGYEKGRWGKRRQSIHFGRRYTPDPFPISPIPRTDKWWGLFGRRPGYLGLRVGWVSVKNDECWCFISWPKEQNEDLSWNGFVWLSKFPWQRICPMKMMMMVTTKAWSRVVLYIHVEDGDKIPTRLTHSRMFTLPCTISLIKTMMMLLPMNMIIIK